MNLILGKLASGLLGDLLAGKGVTEADKEQLEQARIFPGASSFD